MRRLATIFLGLCLVSAALGQTLTEARAVDIGTTWVQWSPSGYCLAYQKETDSGSIIGLYPVGTPQATLLLRLNKGDECNLEWFKSQDAAIVNVSHREGDERRLTLYLLEARTPTPVKLFEQTAAASDNPSIDMNLSPLLEHAIFGVHIGEHSYHLILPAGGTSLVASNDLDVAQRQGLIGPKWGSSGTAFYLDRKSADAAQVNLQPDTGSGQDQLLWAILKAETDSLNHPTGDVNQDSFQQAFTSGLVQSLKDRLTPAPPEGDTGLELMPDVGALRQVRSPGPWRQQGTVAVTATQTTPASVSAGKLVGKSQSLWLIASDNRWSLLVAPSSQNSWLSPSGRAIAYTVDGALFVRTLKF